jgi:hypothetical protein
VSTIRRLAPWLIALFGAGVVPAGAQNIDAGKSPAQIFGDTCAGCHKNARELRRASTSFLRSHYMTGATEAAAMASYLTGLPPDPRAALQKRTPGVTGTTPPVEAAKQPPRPNLAEQAKAGPGQPASKAGRRPGNLETHPEAAAVPDEKPSELAPAPVPAASPLAMPTAPPPMPTATPSPVVAVPTPPAPSPAAAPTAPMPTARTPVAAASTALVLEPFEE